MDDEGRRRRRAEASWRTTAGRRDDELGILGIGSPRGGARRLERQAKPYALPRRPVLPAFELLDIQPGYAPSFRRRRGSNGG